MSPDDQRILSDRVTACMSLTDVRLYRLSVELKNAAPELPLRQDADIARTEYEKKGSFVVFYLGYRFHARDKNKKPVWDASFTLSVTFRVGDKVQVSDDELKAFGAHGVLEIAHPYVRELLHNITARMNVPALVLEVIVPTWGRPMDPAATAMEK